MFMIFSIAAKNIWRNRLRSLVVISAVAIGLVAGIFSVALMDGVLYQRIDSAIHNEVSSLQLHRAGYLENNETDFTIAGADSIAEIISVMPEVQAVSLRLKTEAMVNSGHGPRGIILLGVKPEQEKKVTALYKHILDSAGSYFGVLKRNPAVVGEALANKLKVHLHSKIRVDAVSKEGEPVSAVFRIVGIFKTDNSVFDETNVFVRYKDMRRLLGFDRGEAHEIAVLTTDITATDSLQNRLTRMFTRWKIDSTALLKMKNGNLKPYILRAFSGIAGDGLYDYSEMNRLIKRLVNKEDMPKARELIFEACRSAVTVENWGKLAPDLELSAKWLNLMLYIFVGIILLALGFGIINTMLMVVLERIKELGMLMAVGMNRLRVYIMVMVETVLLSLTGGLAGIVLSYLVILTVSHTGIDLSAFSEGLNSIGYSTLVYPRITFDDYVKIVLMVIATGILAALYPAWKAVKLNPAEAIRME